MMIYFSFTHFSIEEIDVLKAISKNGIKIILCIVRRFVCVCLGRRVVLLKRCEHFFQEL